MTTLNLKLLKSPNTCKFLTYYAFLRMGYFELKQKKDVLEFGRIFLSYRGCKCINIIKSIENQEFIKITSNLFDTGDNERRNMKLETLIFNRLFHFH